MTVLDRDALKTRVDTLIRNETDPDTISPTDVSDALYDIIDSCWNTTDGTAETLTAGDVVSNGDVTATDASSGDSGAFTTLTITNLLASTFAGVAGAELTISSGSITVTNMAHQVDTEGDASTDNLDTIADTGLPVWSMLMIKPASASRDIVIRDDVGNIHTPGSLPITLSDTTDVALLIKVGANAWWCFFTGESGLFLPLSGGTMTGAILGSSNPNVGDATTGRMGVGYFTSIDVTGNVDGVDVAAHAARHITGGADQIDGDQLDIDWNPSNYTPATTPTEANNVDNLTAHLYGIDQSIGTAVAHAAASNPHSGSASTADLAAYLLLAGGTMSGAILGSSNPDIGNSTTGRMGSGYFQALLASTSVGTSAAPTPVVYTPQVRGETSIARNIGATTRSTLSASDETWNFGSNDVSIGDGYVSIPSLGVAAVSTGDGIRLARQAGVYVEGTSGSTAIVFQASFGGAGNTSFGPSQAMGGSTDHTILRAYGGDVLLQKDGVNEAYIGDGFIAIRNDAAVRSAVSGHQCMYAISSGVRLIDTSGNIHDITSVGTAV